MTRAGAFNRGLRTSDHYTLTDTRPLATPWSVKPAVAHEPH